MAILTTTQNGLDFIGGTTYIQTGGTTLMSIAVNGNIAFNQYGAGTLVTDASGNITVSSGGGAGGPYVTISTAQTVTGIKSFSGKIGADGGIDGLTLANGGITGTNYDIRGVNQLVISDPGEGIVFTGTATMYLNAVDDATDSILKLTNATQLNLNSTARITSLVDPSNAQDAATKNYVDTEVGNIPSGLAFEGNWNASTDTPTLSGTTQDNGKFWIVSVAGSTNLSGITDWAVGDWAIYVDNGAGTDAWQKVDNSSSLAGQGAAGKVTFWSSTSNVSFNTNFSYDGTNLTVPALRLGDGTDGEFYSDTAGRTAFKNGDFYIQPGVTNYSNYATNQYHGASSGDNHYFRGNPLSGDNWSIATTGIITAPGGNSTEWNTAYDNSVTAISDSGTSTTTITLTQQDGGTLSTSFSNPQGTVTSVATTNGITGGTITSTGTIQVDSTVVRTTGAQTIAGEKTFTNQLAIDTAGGSERMRLYNENNTAPIADSFSGNTSKSYIYFDTVSGSNDPGYIMHESSATEGNEGVLHLVPTDDNSTGDYVSIHGTNDPDVLKLHTSGLIETENLQLQLKSGLSVIYLNDGVTIQDDLTVSGGDITLGGTGRIQGVDTVSATTDAANKAYVDAHPAGTVTSVRAVTNGTSLGTSNIITTSGTMTLPWQGTSAQYVNGAGNLTTFPTIPQGDITAVTAGAGLYGGGTSGAVTLSSVYLPSFDTRSTNPVPNTTTNGVRFDFKANSTNGLSDGGTYNGQMTWRSYSSTTDLSGGQPYQMAYTANGNLWNRIGATTSWGPWYKFYSTRNSTTVGGNLLTSIANSTAIRFIRINADESVDALEAAAFVTAIGAAPATGGSYLPLSGGTMSGTLTMNGQTISMVNGSIINLNSLTFNDPGADEGVTWNGGNLWKIYESPNTQTNAAGNLQFVQSTTRRLTIDTSGNVEIVGGDLTVGGSINFNGNLNSTGNLILSTASSGANIELYTNGNAYYDAISHNFRDSDASPTYFNITASQVNSYVSLAMNNYKITTLATPTNAADAATKAYVDAHGGGLGPFLPIANPTFTGTLTGPTATITGNIKAGSLSDDTFTRFTNPDGASYVTQASSVTGAIAITLPLWSNPMMRMTIQIYEYSTNESFTVSCGGHNSGTSWYNTFAYIVGNPSKDRRFTIRFGRVASSGLPIVYIGELASTWSYPQVFVTDVQVGFAGYSASWASGWNIGFETGAFENPTGTTIYNSQVGYALSTNTASTSVLRDGSGNFAAGTITAALSGNATTASSAAQVTINYNNNSNANYQMLWGSGNNVYGTGGVYVNPNSNNVYATTFTGALAGNASSATTAGTLTHSFNRTDSASYPVVWMVAGSTSQAYSCAAVTITSSVGRVNATTFNGALTGNATTSTTFSTGRTNYKGATDGAVAGQLMWKNYGNNHTIFDASNSTSPSGSSVNNANSQNAWTGSYPTLMGWNGSQTYGVRVDSARIADNATTAAAYLPLAGGVMSGKIGRSSAIVGFLEGSYNNVGGNSTNTNPIYTIGSSYNPASTTLSNMYGVGYSNAAASFITLTGVTDWGFYVAADGDARVWLDGSSGNISAAGNIYASGGNSTEWNTAYDNSVTALAVTGTTTKTLTATQQDGGTLTASWTDNNDNTNWYVNAATFNTGNGIITGTGVGSAGFTVDIDGRYLQTTGGGMTGPITMNDNVEIRFGTGGATDSRIFYDALDLNIESQGGKIFIVKDVTDLSTGIVLDTSGNVAIGAAGGASASGAKLTVTGNTYVSGDLQLGGGDIILDGTGRIQGVDTVSASTDAANKAYVDTAVAGVPQGDITGVTAGTNLNGGGTSGAVTLNLDAAIELTSVQYGSGVTLSESTDRADLLYINSSTSTWGGLQIGNTSNEFIFSLMGDGSTGGLYDDQNGDWIVQWSENAAVRLYYNGTEKFSTSSAGIEVSGTSDLNGNVDMSARFGNKGTNQGINFEAPTTALQTARIDADALSFYFGGTSGIGSAVRFLENGRVGIGTTAPETTLHVDGVTLIKDSTGVGDLYLGNYATANHFRFHTNNANTYFDMNCGTINWRDGGSTRYYFYPSTANMTINGTLTQNSDSRVKENVVEIGDCISKVQAMRGVYYNRTDFNTEVTKVGVIAQEVEAVLPELILEAPDTGLKSVAYAELTAVLINAIKEQQEIIENLTTRIEQLEN